MDQLLFYLTIDSAYLPDHKVLKETEYATVIDVNKASPSAGKLSRKTLSAVLPGESGVPPCGQLLSVVTPKSVCEDATDMRCTQNMLAKP